MPPKIRDETSDLAEQLAAIKAELERTQHELDRAHNAKEERPEGLDTFIAAVSKVEIPSFWEADPVLWFRQCESAFRRSNTTASGVKFDHIVGKLPNAVSLSCRSLLLSINFEDKDAYERLKAHLCKNFGKSKWQLGYALLDSPGLGDRRPSQLLQDLRALLPPEEVEGTLFQCIFLKKLPSAMSDAIMAADLDNIEAMADMADRLHDKPTTPTVAAVTPCCSHVSAIDSQQRKNNRAGRSPQTGLLPAEGQPHRGGKQAPPVLSRVFAKTTVRSSHGRQEQRKAGVSNTSFLGTRLHLVTPLAPTRKTRQPPRASQCSRRPDLSQRFDFRPVVSRGYRGSGISNSTFRFLLYGSRTNTCRRRRKRNH